jgi:hypothetical protein
VYASIFQSYITIWKRLVIILLWLGLAIRSESLSEDVAQQFNKIVVTGHCTA